MKQKGFVPLIIILVIAIIGIAGYFAYQQFGLQKKHSVSVSCTRDLKLCPDNYSHVGRSGPNCEFTPCPTINPEAVYIASPRADTKLTSPVVVRGTVPAGWMFEGTLPISLQEDNGKIIAQSQAKEVIPGAWQSGKPVEFTATLTFTKSFLGLALLVVEKDNPSGNPKQSENYGAPFWINCDPRPECLDEVPKCDLPETPGMCPKIFWY